MPRPLVHDSLAARLDAMRGSLPQALLLTGPRGVGLATIAAWLAADDTPSLIEPTTTKGDADHLAGNIRIDRIRELYTQLRTHSTSLRVIIIDDADRMNHAAQNAFLKLLEEPNNSVRFILTSHDEQQLLPTIRSRTQLVHVPRVEPIKTSRLITQAKLSPQTTTQLQFIASGLPAEVSRLLADSRQLDQRVTRMTDAKRFIEAPTYDRIVLAQHYAGDRNAALQLVDGAIQILRQSLSRQPDRAAIAKLDTLAAIHKSLAANGNIRLQLLRFVV